MQVIRGIDQLTQPIQRAVVTIGNFDGVHLGHRSILEEAVRQARSTGGTAVAFTFRPHPQVALKPGTQLPLLTTYDEKLELLGSLGIDVILEEPFSREFSTTPASQFFTDVLLGRLNAQAVVVGYDFAFGRERNGNLKALEEFCQRAGVKLTVVQPHRTSAEVVSSTRIRQYLMAGDVPGANRLLGREFFYRGVVVRGEGRGRKLGFPTANLRLENKIALPYGVYATRAVLGGTSYPSVTNVGTRPTFSNGEDGTQELPALVECHLMDQTLDLYGQNLEVRFVARLRDEKRFSGVDALKTQIALDADQARKLLSTS